MGMNFSRYTLWVEGVKSQGRGQKARGKWPQAKTQREALSGGVSRELFEARRAPLAGQQVQ